MNNRLIYDIGTKRPGFDLCMGVRKRRQRRRQLQLRRLHQLDIHNLNKQRHTKRQHSLVLRSVLVHNRLDIQQRLVRRASNNHDRLAQELHRSSHRHFGFGSSSCRNNRYAIVLFTLSFLFPLILIHPILSAHIGGQSRPHMA